MKTPPDRPRIEDEETVAALVQMLSGMGIDRSRINAMIDKARPCEVTPPTPAANRNPGRMPGRRIA